MRNIELKARLRDLERATETARALGARDCGPIRQVDTYFPVSSGRLKIRQINDEKAGQLVAYDRPDQPEARACDYTVVPAPDAEALLEALSRTLGVRAVVRKTRRLFLWKNVRIHLDRVDELGDFLEFEAVLGEKDTAEQAQADLDYLSRRFDIQPQDILSRSYGEMV
ncbi:MAG: class IV adenylate cyclase [Candidatus Sumerlaeota bacterium]|nr:class IV adenylate cyclase [Candidatus Sumerlaeota bacterium]